jgi:hypothetical protein
LNGSAPLDGLGEVLPQVEPVGDLDGVRCPAAAPLNGAGPVPADHLDAGMGGQPVRERLGVPAFQQVKRRAGLAVDDDRAVVLPAPDGEVIDPGHPRAGAAGSGAAMTSRTRTCLLAGMPRIAASRDPARPASATAMSCSARPSGGVLRPQGTVRPWTCSANVLRLQPGAGQKNRRTASRITTRRPPMAASASRLA